MKPPQGNTNVVIQGNVGFLGSVGGQNNENVLHHYYSLKLSKLEDKLSELEDKLSKLEEKLKEESGPFVFLFGFIGGVGGIYAGKKIGEWFRDTEFMKRKTREWFEKQNDEEYLKALNLASALCRLETSLKELDKSKVESCFRKKALFYHPDKQLPSATEEEKIRSRLTFEDFLISKKTLLIYLDKRNRFSTRFEDIVNDLLKKMNLDDLNRAKEEYIQKSK